MEEQQEKKDSQVDSRKLILASASPRRREILEQVEIPFVVMVSQVEEHMLKADPPVIVQELARQKAEAVAVDHPQDIVLGADTIVVCDGRIMGKPKNRADAEYMIKTLAGKSHEVYTGVAVCSPEERFCFYEQTVVTIRPMREEEIQEYVDTKEPYDKAGAYAVQGRFARYVERIEGDFYNVMGLPVSRIYTELRKRKLLCY